MANGKQLGVRLDCFEEGYMRVEILDSKEHCIGSIYWVEGSSETKLYGMFLGVGDEEEEYYADTPAEGIALFASWRG